MPFSIPAPRAFCSDNGIGLTRASPLRESKEKLLSNLLCRRRGMSAELNLTPSPMQGEGWDRGRSYDHIRIKFLPPPYPSPCTGEGIMRRSPSSFNDCRKGQTLTGTASGCCGYDFGHEFKTSATKKRIMKMIATRHSTVVSRMYLQSPFNASNSAVKF
jgi:hypothetical protein